MAISFNDSPYESLSPALRRHVESRLRRRAFHKGQHLYTTGMEHQGLFWFRSGIALSYKTTDDGDYDIAVPIYRGVWTAPSFVNGQHAMSQVAMTTCVVDSIDPDASASLAQDREFMKLISAWCAEDFSLLVSASATINQGRAEDKILSYVRNAIKISRNDPNADETTMTGELEWPFTISQMARFTRFSRPHLSLVLSNLAADQRLEIGNGRLVLHY
ncbi:MULTISPECIES: Crp/Fnr family transcriptional regulator [unclassified Roseitalea]|uniref:Crp/Fnr family transcriptional regulator n=1 Tax=unclassified Roseitalea TaxID=2639107 RepID=UPI00273F42D1|nr:MULTISPECIES: Crp/Fnr family transcriptional regulator [unclassified Roseitalea]